MYAGACRGSDSGLRTVYTANTACPRFYEACVGFENASILRPYCQFSQPPQVAKSADRPVCTPTIFTFPCCCLVLRYLVVRSPRSVGPSLIFQDGRCLDEGRWAEAESVSASLVLTDLHDAPDLARLPECVFLVFYSMHHLTRSQP